MMQSQQAPSMANPKIKITSSSDLLNFFSFELLLHYGTQRRIRAPCRLGTVAAPPSQRKDTDTAAYSGDAPLCIDSMKLSALTTWMRRPARLSFPSGSIAFVNKHLRSTVQSSFDLTIIYLTTDFCKAVQYGGNGNLRRVIVSRAIHCAMQTWPEEHCKQTSWQTSQGASAVTAATWLHIQCQHYVLCAFTVGTITRISTGFAVHTSRDQC